MLESLLFNKIAGRTSSALHSSRLHTETIQNPAEHLRWNFLAVKYFPKSPL